MVSVSEWGAIGFAAIADALADQDRADQRRRYRR